MDSNEWSRHEGLFHSSSPSKEAATHSRQQHGAVASSSVYDARRLLANYPMASATPTSHVARHLSSLTVATDVPSYIQPYQVYSRVASTQSPPGHSIYLNPHYREIHYLATGNPEGDRRRYWHTARDAAVRLLNNSAGSQQSNMTPTLQSSPSFSTSMFAQSVFDLASPTVSQPSSPGKPHSGSQPTHDRTKPMYSSSSLAHALVPLSPSTSSTSTHPPTVGFHTPPPPSYGYNHPPVGSVASSNPTFSPPLDPNMFFDAFLGQTKTQMTAGHKTHEMQTTQHLSHTNELVKSNDPYLTPTSSPMPNGRQFSGTPNHASYIHSPSNAFRISPQKRKSEEQMQSPIAKRIAFPEAVNVSFPPPTPSSHAIKQNNAAREQFAPQVFAPSTPKKMLAVLMPPVPEAYLRIPKSGHVQHDETREQDIYLVKLEGGKPISNDGGLSAKGSVRRPNDRDDRVYLDKLISTFEEIFDAEDSIDPDAEVQSLSPEYFSASSTEVTAPMLNATVIRNLIKQIDHVARPTKRFRTQTHPVNGSPRVWGRIAEIEISILSRILKILGRSVRAGEHLDPFVCNRVKAMDPLTASPRKQKKSVKNTKAISRDDEDGTAGDTLQSELPQITQADIDGLVHVLEISRDSVLAADASLAILTSDRLNKQLYSEEIIMSCLTTLKNQLDKILYPFIEIGNSLSRGSGLLQYIADNSLSEYQHRLSEIFQEISSVIPRITLLINSDLVVMSDSIIIQAVYIAIGPFFANESSMDSEGKVRKGSSVDSGKHLSLRGLRFDALSLIRTIYANHESQRAWIIEEILSSLLKLSNNKQSTGQFRLRDGRSIRTVSALLLQLVQTSVHDVHMQAGQLAKARQQAEAIRRQDSMKDTCLDFLTEDDYNAIRLYTSGLDAALKSAKTIVLFLTNRSGTSKATKNSNESEYRAVLENLIQDLLTILHWPEWPAASLLLTVICKYMVTSLDDVKTTSQVDNNAAKSIALDHLGIIAARIRTNLLKVQKKGQDLVPKPLDEITPSVDVNAFEILNSKYYDMTSYLARKAAHDLSYESARELVTVTWGQEIASALKQIDIRMANVENEGAISAFPPSDIKVFGGKLKVALMEIWKDHSADVFDANSDVDLACIDDLAEILGSTQGMRSLFQPILNVILSALDAPPVFMRTKALRALGQIVTSDPEILSARNVRSAIETHLLDSSPAVRDAAVELIGKYLVDLPQFAETYYQKIAERIADTGLAVRKRVIKLLRTFYFVTEDHQRRIDIGMRLILRMLDEDDAVKDLAIKAVEELWFQVGSPTIPRSKGDPSQDTNEKTALLSKVSVIMSVAAGFKDRLSPLEDTLHKIISTKEGSEASQFHVRYVEICETLIDGLVDASDLPGFTVANCIRTIHLFASAYPSVLSGSHASILLPYLKNPATSEEQLAVEYLLRIFRKTLPRMPKTALKFGNELQRVLQPMIMKPSAGGIAVLQESVACLCSVIQHLTHDYKTIVALTKSCNTRVQQAIARPAEKTMAAQEYKTLSVLIFIVSLLVEHCDFDKLRSDNQIVALEISTVSKGPVITHVYESLLTLYHKYTDSQLRHRILQCLGFLFRARPVLMTLEKSSVVMDAIFVNDEEEGKGRLLKIMQDFLVSESEKHAAMEKENFKSRPKGSQNISMAQLVGNTDEFAESGVSSAIVQRYLEQILDSALSLSPQIQNPAVDILSFTIKQGLAHPIQCFPVVVALETSSNSQLCARANALHAILHNKHASLLNTRYVECVKASFNYQKKVCGSADLIRGHRSLPVPTALLQRWYSLVREKRASRQEFLKTVLRVFDIGNSLQSTQEDILFTRYMAENFSAFDYKTQEEVLTVIKTLTSSLSTTGMQLLAVLAPNGLLNELMGNNQSPPDGVVWHPVTSDSLPLMRCSVIVGMLMLLKAYLKSLYGISEEKCSKFVIGKKSAIGDRTAMKRHDQPLNWDRMPFIGVPLVTSEDAMAQKIKFLEIWNEDGVSGELEEEFPMDM